MSKYNSTLNNYLSFYEINYLTKSNLFHVFDLFSTCEFGRDNEKLVATRIKYSSKEVWIPLELDCVMTALFQSNLQAQGIFRVNGKFEEVNEVSNNFQYLISQNFQHSDIVEYLLQQKIHVLCDIFTRTLTTYNGPLFPKRLRNIFEKIWKIKEAYDRQICLKLLFICFPYKNRQIFESIGKFVVHVSNENTKDDPEHKRSMDVHGICVSLMPAIVISKGDVLSVEKLGWYTAFLHDLFSNMEQILDVTDTF
ncbi:Rho-type GTPase activating protein Rga1, partial [Conglomerata obtusa]